MGRILGFIYQAIWRQRLARRECTSLVESEASGRVSSPGGEWGGEVTTLATRPHPEHQNPSSMNPTSQFLGVWEHTLRVKGFWGVRMWEFTSLVESEASGRVSLSGEGGGEGPARATRPRP